MRSYFRVSAFLLGVLCLLPREVLANSPECPNCFVCTEAWAQTLEKSLERRALLAGQYAKNTKELLLNLESLQKQAKSTAYGSSALFATSGSTLVILSSAKIAAVAGAKAGKNALMKAIEKGATWIFKWRTGGNTPAGYVFEYLSNAGTAILLNDHWAARPLKPLLREIEGIGKIEYSSWSPGPSGGKPSRGRIREEAAALSELLADQHRKLAELESAASARLHDGRLLSLGWDDVHHIEVLLAATRARYRLHSREQSEIAFLLQSLRSQCDGTYLEAVRLLTEFQDRAQNIRATDCLLQ